MCAEEPVQSDGDQDASSSEEESDEIDALLQEEQLRQQYRQRIVAMKDDHHTPEFLHRFVEVEALKSSNVTGLETMACFRTVLAMALPAIMHSCSAPAAGP